MKKIFRGLQPNKPGLSLGKVRQEGVLCVAPSGQATLRSLAQFTDMKATHFSPCRCPRIKPSFTVTSSSFFNVWVISNNLDDSVKIVVFILTVVVI